MTEIEVQDLVVGTGGVLRVGGTRRITGGVCTDSRTVRPGSVFFALCGDKFDGNTYAPEVSQRAAAVVVKRLSGEYHPDCSVVQVEDGLQALQKLATWWRRRLPLLAVAVTGSCGKTGTKDMVRSVLAQHFAHVAATRGNFNNHVGVPLSILDAPAETQVAVWELGMNHAGELAPLCAMSQPNIGIITHIGSAHIGMLGSRDAIAHEKCTVARALPKDGCVIYPAGDDYADYIAAQTQAELLPVGGVDSIVRARDVDYRAQGSNYTLVIEGVGEVSVQLPVPGEHMVNNSLLAAAAGWKLGCSLQEIAAGLANTTLTGGRLSCREEGGVLLVDDTYNANPESMIAALRTVASMAVPGRHFAVLGKMGELGSTGVAAHAEVGRCAATSGYAGVVVLGEGSAELHALVEAARSGGVPVQRTESVQHAAQTLRSVVRPGDAVLFKGSRAAGIERVMDAFLNCV